VRQGWWPLALWTGLIVLVVFPWFHYQNHTHWQRVAWIPFVSPPIKIRDIVVNLLLYAPWGYFGARAMRSRQVWVVVALAAMLSLVTEWSQLYSHGRFPSATDLTCNILGACAGAMYERSRTRSGTM
jgi:glycopeptide antibiotics resistance protein